jgi:multidrug resistance efflux pump
MKRINTIYIVSLILAVALYMMYVKVKGDSAFFYGFAQNKETEINHNKNVLIQEVYVTPGQEVKKGDLLLIVQNTSIPSKINELKLKKEVVSISSQQEIKRIRNRIQELQFEKSKKLSGLNQNISELEEKIELNKSLYEGLKSVNYDSKDYKSRNQLKLEFLKKSVKSLIQSYDQEIAFQRSLLQNVDAPLQIKKEIIDSEIEHYQAEQEKLRIYAPSDGLIGNIFCKKGEYFSAFKSFLDFYQMNPTLVKGFVHESLLLKVQVGNKLRVSSSMHPEHSVLGIVTGLGSRIVEIPERLRKIPEIKSYGREVLISIPSDNKFLQKEKVMLTTIRQH